jgi:WS/DGAT/MGAT family acyltransferase
MDRLNPLDAQFIDAEDEDKHSSFAISSVAVFEGPPPSYDEFRTALAGRLPLVPRYRQKLRTVPWRLGPPVWVDDPAFDLSYHVRQTAVPSPGGDAQLATLMARVMSQRLDRDYPLWEYWLVHGLAQDRWAVISKVHHCMVDGVSGTDLYRVIFDQSPEPSPPVTDERTVTSEPSGLSLALSAALDLARLPVKDAIALRGALARPGDTLRQAADTVRGLLNLARSLPPATGSSLSGPIGRQRRYTWARASLDDVKTIKRELGGTVNDVVLAAISSGFRALLLDRGEQPEPHMIRSLIPVSMRAPGDEGICENRVSVLLAELPVDLADPVERLDAVRARLSALKESKEAMAGEAIVALGRYAPYLPAALGVRLAYRLPQREIVTVTTNVPGPRQPLYAMGRRLAEIIPYVPIATSLRTGISIFTYCDKVTFGITGDYATTADLQVLADGIAAGIAELLEAASRKSGPTAALPPAGQPQPRPARPRASAGMPKARASAAKPKPRASAGKPKARASAGKPKPRPSAGKSRAAA